MVRTGSRVRRGEFLKRGKQGRNEVTLTVTDINSYWFERWRVWFYVYSTDSIGYEQLNMAKWIDLPCRWCNWLLGKIYEYWSKLPLSGPRSAVADVEWNSYWKLYNIGVCIQSPGKLQLLKAQMLLREWTNGGFDSLSLDNIDVRRETRKYKMSSRTPRKKATDGTGCERSFKRKRGKKESCWMNEHGAIAIATTRYLSQPRGAGLTHFSLLRILVNLRGKRSLGIWRR